MKIKELFNTALLEIKLKWSKGTYNHYKGHLKHFLNWCDAKLIYDVKDLKKSIIIDYIADIKETCSNRTLNIRVGNLKRAFKYSKVETDIFNNIGKFPETKKTFDMIQLPTLKKIRQYAFSLNDTVANNLMTKAIILLLMDTGVRRTELCMIEKRNVNLTERTIKLTHTKTNEDRIVPFKEKTLPVIQKLLELNAGHKYLIHNKIKDRPINTEDIIYTLSKKLFRDTDIKVHAHMFRHSFASIMLENDAQLKVVMDLMGHKNIETTERYTHISKKRIKNTYDKSYDLDGD